MWWKCSGMRWRRWINGGSRIPSENSLGNELSTHRFSFYHLFLLLLFSCLLIKICVHFGDLHQPLDHRICAYSTLVQFSSVAQSCPTLCDPMNRSPPGLPVHHQLLEFTQTHVHRVSDAIQPSHPLSSPSPPAPNPSQHQSLFQWLNSSHEVAKVLEFQI